MIDVDSQHFVHHARYGRLDQMKELLRNKVIDINYVSKEDIWKSTALHWSGNNGHAEVVKFLLEKGASTNIKDWNGETCLESALNRAEPLIMDVYFNFDKDEFLSKLRECFVKLCKNGNTKSVELCAKHLSLEEMSESLENDPWNTLWNACKDGHFEVVKIVLKVNPELIHRQGLDGTTPLFMAFCKDRVEILAHLKNEYGIEHGFNEIEYRFNNETPNFMTELTKKYPMFNDRVEDEVVLRHAFKKVTFEAMNENLIGDLCPIKRAKEKLKDVPVKIMYLSDLDTAKKDKCRCGRKADCLMVSDLIGAVQYIEERLISKMPELHPKFVLVGSLAEGTRIQSATEMDLTVKFIGLEKYPLNVDCDRKCALAIPKDDDGSNHPLYRFCRRGTFNFEQFLGHFLACLDEILEQGKNYLERVESATGWHPIWRNLFFGSAKTPPQQRISIPIPSPTDSCKNHHLQSEPCFGSYYTHCERCLVPVTQTKCGACLIFKWSDSKREKVFTIDLIPVFPVKGLPLEGLFSAVISHLLFARPPNWVKYAKKFMGADRILPETYLDTMMSDGEQTEHLYVGMKAINFRQEENNFVIRPAQQLAIASTFDSEPFLKDVYCRLKYLKATLKVDISSYLIKKILLTDKMKEICAKNAWFESVWFVLQHPDIKAHFKHIVAYEPPHLYQKFHHDVALQ